MGEDLERDKMDKETAEKEERIVKAYRNGFGAYLLARLHSTTP